MDQFFQDLGDHRFDPIVGVPNFDHGMFWDVWVTWVIQWDRSSTI